MEALSRQQSNLCPPWKSSPTLELMELRAGARHPSVLAGQLRARLPGQTMEGSGGARCGAGVGREDWNGMQLARTGRQLPVATPPGTGKLTGTRATAHGSRA